MNRIIFFTLVGISTCLLFSCNNHDPNDVDYIFGETKEVTKEEAERNKFIEDSIAIVEKENELKERKSRTYSPRQFLEMIAPYYAKNTVSADNKFQGQVYYIKGEVADVSRNIAGDIFFNIGMGHPYQNVQCFVDNASEIENISVGQKVTAKCVYQSLFAAGQVNLNIRMEHCEIVND
jgi:pyridoxine 5'-phosphate synthase PdxJ